MAPSSTTMGAEAATEKVNMPEVVMVLRPRATETVSGDD